MPQICIHCDSQSTIGRAQNSMYNGKSKHIGRRHNTIRQLLSTRKRRGGGGGGGGGGGLGLVVLSL